MSMPSEVTLVFKKSKLELYVRENKDAHVTALLDAQPDLMRPLVEADDVHRRALDTVQEVLTERGLRFKTIYRGRLRPESTRDRLVVTVGGDGTVLDASRKCDEDAVVLGVNSDPHRSNGFLCCTDVAGFSMRLDALLSAQVSPTFVQRLGASVDDVDLGVRVLNDVLIAHRNPAATARYDIACGSLRETQKSSGVWVSAPAGSTGAMASAGGDVQHLDDNRLQYRVRELYRPTGEPSALTGGFLLPDETLVVCSRMREGVLFLDGPHQRVPLPMGATFQVHHRVPRLRLVVTSAMRARREALKDALAS